MCGAWPDKDRRRQETAARMAAAGITPPPVTPSKRSPLVYVAAVLGVAVIIGLVVLATRGSGNAVAAAYKVAASDGVVTLGDPAAPVKVDIYEDYICPGCKIFAGRDHDELTTALNEGKITVRFHPVAILNDRSDPAGYSTRAANAALCAADAGIFPAYHDRLFAEQPSEGGPGLTDAMLATFGTQLGANVEFGECVGSGTHALAIGAETKKAVGDPALRSDSGFGTPTAAVGGRKVSVARSGWLEDALSGR